MIDAAHPAATAEQRVARASRNHLQRHRRRFVRRALPRLVVTRRRTAVASKTDDSDGHSHMASRGAVRTPCCCLLTSRRTSMPCRCCLPRPRSSRRAHLRATSPKPERGCVDAVPLRLGNDAAGAEGHDPATCGGSDPRARGPQTQGQACRFWIHTRRSLAASHGQQPGEFSWAACLAWRNRRPRHCGEHIPCPQRTAGTAPCKLCASHGAATTTSGGIHTASRTTLRTDTAAAAPNHPDGPRTRRAHAKAGCRGAFDVFHGRHRVKLLHLQHLNAVAHPDLNEPFRSVDEALNALIPFHLIDEHVRSACCPNVSLTTAAEAARVRG